MAPTLVAYFNPCRHKALCLSKVCDLRGQKFITELGKTRPKAQTSFTLNQPSGSWGYTVSCFKCESQRCLRGDVKFLEKLHVFHYDA